MTGLTKYATADEARAAAERWDAVADNETENETDYMRYRQLAAACRRMADDLAAAAAQTVD